MEHCLKAGVWGYTRGLADDQVLGADCWHWETPMRSNLLSPGFNFYLFWLIFSLTWTNRDYKIKFDDIIYRRYTVLSLSSEAGVNIYKKKKNFWPRSRKSWTGFFFLFLQIHKYTWRDPYIQRCGGTFVHSFSLSFPPKKYFF